MKRATTAGKSGPTAVENSSANSRRERAVPTAGNVQLKFGEVVTTIPTIDSNVGTVEYKNLRFIVQKDTEMIH